MSKPSSDPRTVYQQSEVDVPAVSHMYRTYVEGDVIAGKYELVRLLGSGGMGAVWVARNRQLDIEVCLKLIRQGPHESEHRDRLQREARAAARLNDPSIVRVSDFGTTEAGEPYIVMELLHGSDLRTVLMERDRLPPEEAVQLLLPIIRGIATAHEAGIVHRDIKPENIFVARTASGGLQPKLLDFGIARLDAEDNARLTKTGAVLGSPAYMSPEQARGELTDFRCDLWAAILVLHEMLTGKATFDAPNYNAALQLILGKDPEPISSYGIREPVLASILETGLNKDVTRRFQSAKQIGRVLADWLLSRGVMSDLAGVSLREDWFSRVRTPKHDQEQLSANRVQLGHSDTQLVGTAESFGTRVQKRNWKLALAGGLLAPVALVGVLVMRDRSLSRDSKGHANQGISVAPALPASSMEIIPVPPSRAFEEPSVADTGPAAANVASSAPSVSASASPSASANAGGAGRAGLGGAAEPAHAAGAKAAGKRAGAATPAGKGNAAGVPAAQEPAAAPASPPRPAPASPNTEESFKNPFE